MYVCVRMARAKEMPRVRVGSEAVVRGGRKRGRGEEGGRGPKGSSGGGGGGGSVQVDRGVQEAVVQYALRHLKGGVFRDMMDALGYWKAPGV